MYDSINTMLNANADTEDSDDEFTLKDVVDKNVGSILDAATSADDEDDDDEVRNRNVVLVKEKYTLFNKSF